MASHAVSSSSTLPLQVKNTAFMLDRLGMDCDKLQFLRELTKNAIEAIQKTPEKIGEVVWDVDWLAFEMTGIYKLSITDTGIGMSGPDMVEYINHLSSSGGLQAHFANFGVGAKISAATRNHAGLIYLSWKSGAGSMIHLWRDPENEVYGLKQLERPNGSFGHWASLEDSAKPELIKTHGTRVILFGNDESEHTIKAPEGVASPSRWITKYLNTRFFRFPEGITVKAREGWEYDLSDRDRNLLRTITGQKAYLDSHAVSSGLVRLSGAVAHWWILRDEKAIGSNSGFINSSGHCAALWDDELYEMTTGRGNTAALQNFGVVFGYNRVVLYVEPHTVPGVEIFTNTARTQLLLNNKSLPWADWQAEFREKMPPEILKHMEEVSSASEHTDHKDSIKDRLKQIEELFKLSRYRPTSKGKLLAQPQDLLSGGGPERSGVTTGASKGGKGTGSVSGSKPSVYSLFLSENGEPAEQAKPDIFPDVRWISVNTGTREPGDMEDRAARYLPAENTLLINADFRVFTDMTNRWNKHYTNVPGASTIVLETVREWFEQSLVEAVVSSNSLRDSKHWNQEDVSSLTSEQGLTAAVLPRWHIEQSIKRSLGSKMGALKSNKAA